MKPLPKVGKTYNCFDDGKISKSRLYTVDVVKIVRSVNIDPDTNKIYSDQVKRSPHLFHPFTDYFIFTENGEDGDAVFVRTKYGGWFSLGDFMNSGLLDVDGELTKRLNNEF